MSAARAYERRPVLWRRCGDEILVAVPERDGVGRLSEPASLVWHLLDRPSSAEALTAEVASRFDDSGRDVADRVEAMLAELVAEGWIRPVASDG